MQLTIFDKLRIEKANDLLEALNDGKKEKDKYTPKAQMDIGDFEIFIAENKQKEIVANAIHKEGFIPHDFCVCWRLPQLVMKDISSFYKNA